jgi:hypothetical protein
MAGWDATMPAGFTDGQVVDELDLDPMVNNINWLRYSTVFMGGVRRTSNIGSITGTEVNVMETPVITQEEGYLYKIEGMCKISTSQADNDAELKVHQGSGLAGANLQSFLTPTLHIVSAGYMVPFNVFVKATSTGSASYTLGVKRQTGTGACTVFSTSWMAILRSGDNALLTDV